MKMKKNLHYLLLTLAALIGLQATAAVPSNYYNTALGKSDRELMLSLHTKIKGHYMVFYKNLWARFETTDFDGTYIIDRYSTSQFTFQTDQCGTYNGVGDCYNREHSVPQSWWGGTTEETEKSDTMYTDLYHMYPVDGWVNNERSNYPFGDCANGVAKGTGKLGNCTHSGYTGRVFEVADEYKGDFARSYFYMVVRYMHRVGAWTNGEGSVVFTNSSYKHLTPWAISQLLEWHRNDPVSALESARNEAVYNIQHNRNPFIDHPELAEFLWGNQTGVAWTGSSANTPIISSPSNGSTVNVGTNSGSGVSKVITVKGVNLTQTLNVSVTGTGFSVSPSSLTAAAANAGTSVTVTYNGTATNATGRLTITSSEATSNVTLTATYNTGGGSGGTEIIETWEGCAANGNYSATFIQGHAFGWNVSNVGLYSGDEHSNGLMSCRYGKNNNSYIEMAEDVTDGASMISFYAAKWSSSEANPTLQVLYSTNGGTTWTSVGTCQPTLTWQQFIFNLNVNGNVRFKIAQTAGARLNIDDISITSNPIVAPDPVITISPLAQITAVQGSTSGYVTGTVVAENNDEAITLTVGSEFQLSINKRTWRNSLTLDASGEVFYVRLADTSTLGEYQGTVTASTSLVNAYADVTGVVNPMAGDVNMDGTVNVTDVTALVNYLLGGSSAQISIDAADMSGDGSVNVTDVTMLINSIMASRSFMMGRGWDAVPVDGGILVENPDGEELEVYDFDGNSVMILDNVGETNVSLPMGIYIVASDSASRKVVVR